MSRGGEPQVPHKNAHTPPVPGRTSCLPWARRRPAERSAFLTHSSSSVGVWALFGSAWPAWEWLCSPFARRPDPILARNLVPREMRMYRQSTGVQSYRQTFVNFHPILWQERGWGESRTMAPSCVLCCEETTKVFPAARWCCVRHVQGITSLEARTWAGRPFIIVCSEDCCPQTGPSQRMTAMAWPLKLSE